MGSTAKTPPPGDDGRGEFIRSVFTVASEVSDVGIYLGSVAGAVQAGADDDTARRGMQQAAERLRSVLGSIQRTLTPHVYTAPGLRPVPGDGRKSPASGRRR